MLRTLGKLRRLLSGARAGLRREEMDGAHYATLGDRPFVGCQPCAPDPQGRAAPAARPNPPAAPRPAGDDG